jgi:thioredoxin 1
VHRLTNDPAFAGVTVFKVDFDSSKGVLREWKVSQQSTLIAFKGTKETLRSTGETDPGALRKLFQAAL